VAPHPSPPDDAARSLRARPFLLAVGVMLVLGVAPPSIEHGVLLAQPAATKHVLLLYSHESALYTQFEGPLRSALTSELAHPVDFYTEYLDLIRFPRERYERQVVDLLRVKYAERRIDLIVIVSSLAFDLVRAHGDELFPRVPIVFASVNAASIDPKTLPSHITAWPSPATTRTR
jgi:hypothetical protein